MGGGAAVADRKHHEKAPRTEKAIENLTLVKNKVKAYYGDTVDATQAPGFTHQASPTSNYARETARVERKAQKFLARHNEAGRKHASRIHAGMPAIVLDVDDTSVLTYEYDANNDFGFMPSINATYVAHGFPAVFGMPALANWAHAKGYAVFFITGRPEAQHADTVANLQGRELDGQSYPVTTTGSLSQDGDSLFTKPADFTTVP